MQAFKLVVNDPDTILGALMREIKEVGPDGKEVTKVVPAVTEEVKEALVMNIKRRMTPQPLKIRADIEMKCFQFDGVIHIKVSIIFLYISVYLLCGFLSCFTIIWFCRRQCGRLKLLEVMIAL
jgi:hypothetical protein